MRSNTETVIRPGELVASLTYGENRRQIFLRLCQIFRDSGLDILDVESHVRRGWFSALILARNPTDRELSFSHFKREISSVARKLDFTAHTFLPPDTTRNVDITANVVVVLSVANRPGLMAHILEVLDQYNVDIMNIDVELDESPQTTFAVQLDLLIPHGRLYEDLTKIRADLEQLRVRLGLENYGYMVHARETFRYLQEIDFEQGD